MPTLDLAGVLAPVPTPFDDQGDVHTEALETNLRRWRESTLKGVLALGSNGEAALLDDLEADLVIETVREAWPRDRVLLVGAGRESTRATIEAARRAGGLGVDAVLVRPPSAFRAQMTPESVLGFFSAVADASPVPILLYNLPGVVGYSLTIDTVATLAEHQNVAGLKETSPDLERLAAFASVGSRNFAVLTGWAPVLHPALVAGAVGGILAVANLIPDACVALCEHAWAGRHREARVWQQRLTPLARLVTSIHGVAGLKFAMERMGYYGGRARQPLGPASARACEELDAAIAAWRALPQEV